MLSRGCTFDEATHAYAMNGRSVPSVTRVLDHGGATSYDMVRRDILERKSVIGSLVHMATAFYDKGTLDWSSLDQFTRGRTEAWASFRGETGFVPRLIEEPYIATVNGMTYGLRIDREGLWKGLPVIIEIKTTANIEPWFAIQTAGYALGVPDPQGLGGSPRLLFARRRRMVVQLFEDGTYFKKDYNDPQDAEVFLSALHLSHWKLSVGMKIKKIEEEVAA